MNQKLVIRILITSNVALILAVLAFLFFMKTTTKEKVAFVNSNKVLAEYMGMKETQEAYQKKIAEKQAKLDTMQLDIQKQEALSGSSAKGQAFLLQSKEHFLKQKEQWEKEVTLEGNQLTQGMLNQINTYIEHYAKEHGYILVHGANASGNILYADQSIDVTEDIIKGLNEKYKH